MDLKGTSNSSNSKADGKRNLSIATIVIKAIRKISNGSSSKFDKRILVYSFIQCSRCPKQLTRNNRENIRFSSKPARIATKTNRYFFNGLSNIS